MAPGEIPPEAWEDWDAPPSSKQEQKSQAVPRDITDASINEQPKTPVTKPPSIVAAATPSEPAVTEAPINKAKESTRPGSYANWAAPAQPHLEYERAVFNNPRTDHVSNRKPQPDSHKEVTSASPLVDKTNIPKQSNGVKVASKPASKGDGTSIAPTRLTSAITVTSLAQNGDHALANQQSVQASLPAVDWDNTAAESNQIKSDVPAISAPITQDTPIPGKQVTELKESPAKKDVAPAQSVEADAPTDSIPTWSLKIPLAHTQQSANNVQAKALCETPLPHKSPAATTPGTPAVLPLSQPAEDSQGAHSAVDSRNGASDTVRSPRHGAAEPLDLKARIVSNLAKQKQAKEAIAVAKKEKEQAALKLAREKQHLKEEQERAAAELPPPEERSVDEDVHQVQTHQHQQQQVALPETKGPTRQPPSDKLEYIPVADRWSTASQAATTGSTDDDVPNMNQPQATTEMPGGAHNNSPVHAERDIRGGDLILPAARIDWEACRGARREPWKQESVYSKVEFGVDSELERYIKFWLKSAHDRKGRPVAASYFQGHESCDIETETGKLLGPVWFLNTKPHPADKSHKPNGHKHFAGIPMPEPEPEHPTTTHPDSLPPSSSPVSSNSGIQQDESDQSTDVQFPCHLRPATLADMQGVAEIHNLEVRSSHRTIDSNEVPEADFVQLYHKLRAQNAPFVVTVKGWHGGGGRSSKSAAATAAVIGFAFVDVLAPGIAGSSATCAATCGRVTLIVHPRYRKKRVGTALMDVILSCCSTDHNPYGGYQFVNPDSSNDKRFNEPASSNPRKWRSLYLEIPIISSPPKSQNRHFGHMRRLTPAEREKELRRHDEWWVAEWLDQRFAMTLVEHRSLVYKHTSNSDQRKSEWLDCLVMSHLCRMDDF